MGKILAIVTKTLGAVILGSITLAGTMDCIAKFGWTEFILLALFGTFFFIYCRWAFTRKRS